MYVCICHAIRERQLNSNTADYVRGMARQTGCAMCLKHIMKLSTSKIDTINQDTKPALEMRYER